MPRVPLTPHTKARRRATSQREWRRRRAAGLLPDRAPASSDKPSISDNQVTHSTDIQFRHYNPVNINSNFSINTSLLSHPPRIPTPPSFIIFEDNTEPLSSQRTIPSLPPLVLSQNTTEPAFSQGLIATNSSFDIFEDSSNTQPICISSTTQPVPILSSPAPSSRALQELNPILFTPPQHDTPNISSVVQRYTPTDPSAISALSSQFSPTIIPSIEQTSNPFNAQFTDLHLNSPIRRNYLRGDYSPAITIYHDINGIITDVEEEALPTPIPYHYPAFNHISLSEPVATSPILITLPEVSTQRYTDNHISTRNISVVNSLHSEGGNSSLLNNSSVSSPSCSDHESASAKAPSPEPDHPNYISKIGLIGSESPSALELLPSDSISYIPQIAKLDPESLRRQWDNRANNHDRVSRRIRAKSDSPVSEIESRPDSFAGYDAAPPRPILEELQSSTSSDDDQDEAETIRLITERRQKVLEEHRHILIFSDESGSEHPASLPLSAADISDDSSTASCRSVDISRRSSQQSVPDSDAYTLTSDTEPALDTELSPGDYSSPSPEEKDTSDLIINFATQLRNHLHQFQGCSLDSHQELDTRCQLSSENTSDHLSIREYCQALSRANVPRVLGKDHFIRADEREVFPIVDWVKIFEGRSSAPDLPSRSPSISSNLSTDSQGDPRQNPTRSTPSPQPSHRSTDSHTSENPFKDSPELCLSCSSLDGRAPKIAFDIDSFLGWARSLAFGLQGLEINFFPRYHTNLTSPLHLYCPVPYDLKGTERVKSVPLHTVPHYCAGRVIGAEDISYYFFFPRMWTPNKPTNFPGKQDNQSSKILQTWTDEILIPALFRHCSATSRQHYPASWRVAKQKAYARAKEQQSQNPKDTASKRDLTDSGPDDQPLPDSILRTLYYAVHPFVLGQVWEDIQEQIRQPEYLIYAGVRIFFSSKNTKLRYPSASLAQAWEEFNTRLSATIDLEYIDPKEVWVDLGKEIVCPDYALGHDILPDDSVPMTYLLRTCCQHKLLQWARFEQPSRHVKGTFWTVAMLRDVCDLTMEMALNSPQRHWGWAYSQSYCTIKEVYDAAKTKPFSSRHLGNLAWDQRVAEMLQATGKAPTVKLPRVKREVLAAGDRLVNALRDCRYLSFGAREEHRLSLSAVAEMIIPQRASDMAPDEVYISSDSEPDYQQSAGRSGDSPQPPVIDTWNDFPITATGLQHIWQISTRDYSNYLYANTNKFMAAIQWVLSLQPEGTVSYEHCKLLTMLIQALPFAFDTGPIRQRHELWQAHIQRRHGGPIVLGMDMYRSLTRCGYPWFGSRIDYESLIFRPALSSQMAFSSSMLREFYRVNWKAVYDSKDDLSRLNAARNWLSSYSEAPRCLQFIQDFVYHLLNKAYRKEVWRSLKNYIRDDKKEACLEGSVTLCWANFQRCFVSSGEAWDFHFVNPRYIRPRNVKEMLQHIWGINDGLRRDVWGNYSFRILFEEACAMFSHVKTPDLYDFQGDFFRHFVATNFMIPYHTKTKFIQRSKQRQVIWTGFWHNSLLYAEQPGRDMFQSVPYSDLRETVSQSPNYTRNTTYPSRTWRRNASHSSAIPSQKVHQYMPDWRLSGPDPTTWMVLIPCDKDATLGNFDSDLEDITIALKRAWRAFQQTQAEDQD